VKSVLWLRNALFGTGDDGGDMLARLLIAANDDPALRQRLIALLSVPSSERQALIATALHEMALRGEPETIRAAFAMLGPEKSAATALRILTGRAAH
jgi:hypothetical protein